MHEIICNTSPIQYLYQIGLLHILPELSEIVTIPPSVVQEISVGHEYGISLTDLDSLKWLKVKHPVSEIALPLISDLGSGETEVLMLGLEMKDTAVILDDLLARKIAEKLKLKLTGTLGLILDAKKAGLINTITPFLDKLESLRFRLSPLTREAVVKMAGE